MTSTAVRPPPRARVTRRRRGTVVAGVAGGVADHLGTGVLRVRVVLTALCALGGSGVLVYAALWLVAPLEPPGRAREISARERWQGAGLAVLGLGLGLAAAGSGVVGWIVGPLGLALVGAAVVWREAETAGPADPGRGRAPWAPGRGVAAYARVAAGVTLVAVGIIAFLLGRLDLGQVQFGLLAALASLVGVVVLTVPWWLRLARDLAAERRARIRGEERAEVAAHLHDSVLQTLALIQKQSADDATGREVRRLARRQERELRTWLHGRTGGGPAALAAALAAAAAEVEDDHGVRVAPIVVGDTVLTDATAAVVAAAREAMVNAAKHSGAEEISVYAECDPDAVAVYVRDRGSGFDPGAVPADRQGLAGSVHARMERVGGRVRVRTAPGDGTEVGLTVPLRPPSVSTAGSGEGTS